MENKAPGATMVKVVSILFIIFGAISIVLAIIALLAAIAVSGLMGAVDAGAGVLTGALLIFNVILACSGGIMEFVAGIVGVKNSNNPAKAKTLITLGVIILVLILINMIISIVGSSFAWTSIIGLVLPVLYILGAMQNKKAIEG